MRARFLSLVAASLLLAASTKVASAKRNAGETALHTLPAELRKSRSVGAAWQGKLTRGVRLEQGADVRHVPEYAPLDHYYGTWQLVQLLGRAARYVSKKQPGGRLSVGEMSARQGGNLPGHASHESGRDVDLGFYMLDARGRPYDAFAYANFDERGRALKPNLGLRFDVTRNWELVARLVTDGDARVQYVFVAPGLRWLLLQEGKRLGATPAVLERAGRVMVAPKERHPHGNHFHVRVYCGPNERPQCTDSAPYWPWYPGAAPLTH
jgi:penicillin-insensitive murein DD-endopeptidase